MGIKRKIQKDIQQRKIEVVFTNERLIPPSGLSIVGGLLRKSELVRLANRMPVKQKRSEPQIKMAISSCPILDFSAKEKPNLKRLKKCVMI